ncbi:MAG: amidinotransferase [Rhodobacterales bacterium]|nr:amidinotransferase [Rhodobacterales bacterium]
MAIAWVRRVSSGMAGALVAIPPLRPVDLRKAEKQHTRYVEGMEWLGFDVRVIAADDALPDCVFVEDTAVIIPGHGILTVCAEYSRRPESVAVRRVLSAAGIALSVPTSDSPLDGGDVLQMGRIFFVGLSDRTSADGAAALERAFQPLGFSVIQVELPKGTLHLKCVVTALSDDTLLLADGTLSPDVFEGYHVISIPYEERYAANVVARNGRVLMSAGYPRAVAAVERAGFQVRVLQMSEFQKADGSLTCLSLRLY